MAIIHHAGSLWTTRIFYILFQSHIPRNASGAWHRRLSFVKRAFGNPHKRIERRDSDTLAFPARFVKCSLSDERKQELLSRFPIGKPSPLCSPPSREVVFHVSIGKGSYGGFWLCKLGFIEKNCSVFRWSRKIFYRKNLHSKTPSQTSLCETKTTDPTGRRIKKKSDLRETGKKFSETSTPSPLESA